MTPTVPRTPNLTEGRILSLTASLTLPIALFAPRGMAVLFGLAALSCLVIGFAYRRNNLIANGWGTWLAALFTILSLASALWSMTPEASMRKALVLGAVLFGGLVLVAATNWMENQARRAFETGLIAGGVLGFTLLGIEVVFDGPLYSVLWRLKGLPPEPPAVLLRATNQGAAVAAMYLLPWVLAMKRRKGTVWAGAGFIICAVLLALGQADSHKAALVVGLAAALVAYFGRRAALRGFSFLCVIGVLAAPWLAMSLPDPLQPDNSATSLPKSAQHRIAIWQTTAGHIFERPLLGSGLDTSRAFYGEDQKIKRYFGGKGTDKTWTNRLEPIPLHPHNGVLQVWLELGLAGALLLSAGLFLIVHRLSAVENNFERSIVFGSFITGLVIFSVSYGVWQSWWMGTVWLMMAYGAAACHEGAS